MRFSFAVSVLAPQALPLVAGSSSIVTPASSDEHQERQKQRSIVESSAHELTASTTDRTAVSNDVNIPMIANKDKKKENVVLARKNVAEDFRPKQTTATKRAAECNPDVGILSCPGGADVHCVTSQDSTLGGFCVDYQKAARTRRLQDGGLCEDIYVDCDCTLVTNGVGAYTCSRPGECIDSDGQVCGSFRDVVTIQTTGAYSKSTCFTSDVGGAVENSFDAPIESYCFTVVSDGTQIVECTLEIDGAECNSCTSISCPDGSFAEEVDCTNINSVATGNSCSSGLNVLELLSGALTPPPTPPPTQTTADPTAPPPTEDSQASSPVSTPAATPAPSPLPTSEVTSGANSISVLIATSIVLLAGVLAAL